MDADTQRLMDDIRTRLGDSPSPEEIQKIHDALFGPSMATNGKKTTQPEVQSKYIITAKVNTLLKSHPVDSSTLPPDQKKKCQAGTDLELTELEIVKNSHLKLKVGGKETYEYAFRPHWEVPEKVLTQLKGNSHQSIAAGVAASGVFQVDSLKVSQPDASTCQSACIAMAIGSTDVLGIRAALDGRAATVGSIAGDPNVMAWYLNRKLGDRYIFDDNASMSEMREWLRNGEFLITHGWFTGSGHVIALDGIQIEQLAYKFDVSDPWSEFSFGSWSYNNPSVQFYDGYYSALGIYAACVAGQSVNDAIRIYDGGNGTYDSNKKGAWVHRIKGLQKVTTPIATIRVKGDELLSKEQADAIYGTELYEKEYIDLINCFQRYKINTPSRMRHFLSQTAHESGGLKWLKELDPGNYLEWRTDLGNNQPGDGPKFKGAGVIQLTGRANYQKLADAVNDPKVMELGCTYVAETYPMTSAGVWWNANRMNELCDRPGVTVKEVTRAVNGGYNGLADREHYYQVALQHIPG